MIEHPGGELELVTEQRRRLAIGRALHHLGIASGRGGIHYREGAELIAELQAGPDGRPRAVVIALPDAPPVSRW